MIIVSELGYIIDKVFYLGGDDMRVNPSNQLTTQNHQQYINSQKNQDIKTSVQSAVAQINGQVKTIRYQYNNEKIQKAVVTVIVSKEEAKKIKQFSDDVDIRIIIDENLSEEKTSNSKETKEENEDIATKEPLRENNTLSKDSDTYNEALSELPEFSMTRGPDNRIYSVINTNNDSRKEKNYDTLPFENGSSLKQRNTLAEKNIKAYKRYNFKNIKIKEREKDHFSMKI